MEKVTKCALKGMPHGYYGIWGFDHDTLCFSSDMFICSWCCRFMCLNHCEDVRYNHIFACHECIALEKYADIASQKHVCAFDPKMQRDYFVKSRFEELYSGFMTKAVCKNVNE